MRKRLAWMLFQYSLTDLWMYPRITLQGEHKGEASFPSLDQLRIRDKFCTSWAINRCYLSLYWLSQSVRAMYTLGLISYLTLLWKQGLLKGIETYIPPWQFQSLGRRYFNLITGAKKHGTGCVNIQIFVGLRVGRRSLGESASNASTVASNSHGLIEHAFTFELNHLQVNLYFLSRLPAVRYHF